VTTRLLLLRAGVERNPGPTLGAGYQGAAVAIAEVDFRELTTVHKRGCARFFAKLDEARSKRGNPTLHVVCLVKSGNQLRPAIFDVTPVGTTGQSLSILCDPQKVVPGQAIPRSQGALRPQTTAHVRPAGQPADDEDEEPFPVELKTSMDTRVILDVAVWGGQLFVRPPWWSASLTRAWGAVAETRRPDEAWASTVPPVEEASPTRRPFQASLLGGMEKFASLGADAEMFDPLTVSRQLLRGISEPREEPLPAVKVEDADADADPSDDDDDEEPESRRAEREAAAAATAATHRRELEAARKREAAADRRRRHEEKAEGLRRAAAAAAEAQEEAERQAREEDATKRAAAAREEEEAVARRHAEEAEAQRAEAEARLDQARRDFQERIRECEDGHLATSGGDYAADYEKLRDWFYAAKAEVKDRFSGDELARNLAILGKVVGAEQTRQEAQEAQDIARAREGRLRDAEAHRRNADTLQLRTAEAEAAAIVEQTAAELAAEDVVEDAHVQAIALRRTHATRCAERRVAVDRQLEAALDDADQRDADREAQRQRRRDEKAQATEAQAKRREELRAETKAAAEATRIARAQAEEEMQRRHDLSEQLRVSIAETQRAHAQAAHAKEMELEEAALRQKLEAETRRTQAIEEEARAAEAERERAANHAREQQMQTALLAQRLQQQQAEAAARALTLQTTAQPPAATHLDPRPAASHPYDTSTLNDAIVKELEASLAVATLRRVEPRLRYQWRTLVRTAICGYETTRSEEAAIALLMLCKRRLLAVVGKASTAQRRTALLKQLAQSPVAPAVMTQAADAATPMDQEERILRKAVRKAKEGFLGRAAKTLATTPAPPAADAFSKLVKLHPLGAAPDECPLPRHFTFDKDFDVDAVREAVRKLMSGATPGPTGWTEELILDALEDAEAARGIAAFVSDVANGRVSRTVRYLLTACTLTGIPKPDGGVRPIAMGDTFLKVASCVAVQTCAEQLKSFFGVYQAGILNASGSQGIVHLVRAHFDGERDASKPIHAATIDLKNAFNSVQRQAIWDVLLTDNRFDKLRPLFAVEYATPSQLLVLDDGVVRHVESTRGTRQGSVLGPIFFCTAIQAVVDALNAIEGVTALAYMDDVTILAENGEQLAQAVEVTNAMMLERGLELNPRKCQWMSPHKTPKDWAGWYDEATLKLLGAYIALNADDPRAAETAALMAKAEKSDEATFFRRLRMLTGAPAAAILGKCAVPRMSYVMRTHHPTVTEKPCARFDAEVTRTWQQLAGLGTQPLDPQVLMIAHLPTKQGGMGFTRNTWVRHAAYCGSLRQAGVKERPTQSVATAAVNNTLTAALAESDRGPILNANSAKGTATWFTDPTTRMHPRDFSAAMRLRLGAAHPKLSGTATCPGCGTTLPGAQWSQHVTGCTRVRGINASTRHTQLKDALKTTAKTNNVACSATEPRFIKTVRCSGCGDEVRHADWSTHAEGCTLLPAARKKEKPHVSGPDIELVLPDDHLLVDVTVVNPLNRSAKRTKPSAIFNRVEADKEARYGAEVANEGAKLVVAAITAQGALSPQFERLLARIAPGDAFFEARRALVAATVAGSGAALRNAESQLGICDPRPAEGDDDDEEDDDGLVAGLDDDATSGQPAPEWMAPFLAGPPAEWGATVAEAIVAAQGEATVDVEATADEQPAAASGYATRNAVPAAATTAEGARTTGADTATGQHGRAPVTAPPRTRGTPPTRKPLAQLAAQLEVVARQQELCVAPAPARSRSIPAPTTAAAATVAETTMAAPTTTAATTVAAPTTAAAAAVATTAVTAVAETTVVAAVATTRQHGRDTAEAAHATAGSERSTTRNNQSLVVSTRPRNKRANNADRWAARVPEPQWWDAVNPYH
jgi:hypothetical protein